MAMPQVSADIKTHDTGDLTFDDPDTCTPEVEDMGLLAGTTADTFRWTVDWWIQADSSPAGQLDFWLNVTIDPMTTVSWHKDAPNPTTSYGTGNADWNNPKAGEYEVLVVITVQWVGASEDFCFDSASDFHSLSVS